MRPVIHYELPSSEGMMFGSTWEKDEDFRLCCHQNASAIEEAGTTSSNVVAGLANTKVA